MDQEFSGRAVLLQTGEVEADIFVAWANTPGDVEHSLKDALFKRWKPIAAKRYAFVRDEAMGMATSGPSVLSIPWAIERYVPMLADAVAGRGNTGADS
ncbi:hypothetical protein ACFV8T_22555 [Streptomyces sp. NPDC059832]|uniref:hypothetical protein n=1 Tax=unclassified Streptomyces TaxID=2593676 RepID=UPI00365C4B32